MSWTRIEGDSVVCCALDVKCGEWGVVVWGQGLLLNGFGTPTRPSGNVKAAAGNVSPVFIV